MNLQQLLSPLRRAVDDYGMINENDKIAIGLSGGKDSTALLYGLTALKKFYPKKFELEAVTVDIGCGMDFSPLTKLCKQLEIRHTIVKTQISEIIFEHRKEKNPCSLCAKMRKGALNNAALDLSCSKIAYAHHKDDLIETMMLSLLFEGHFYCFPPVTHLDETNLTVIRPMMYIKEADITGFKNKTGFPVIKNLCPADGNTKRQYVKDLIRSISKDHPEAKERMYNAIINGKIYDWPDKKR